MSVKTLFQKLAKFVALCAIVFALGFSFQVSPAAAQPFNWGGNWQGRGYPAYSNWGGNWQTGGYPGYSNWGGNWQTGGYPGYYNWGGNRQTGGYPGYYY